MMTGTGLAGLLLGALAMAPGGALDHSVRVEHSGGPADVHYRGNVAVEYRQIGAAGSPGRPSSLRCTWQANLVVDREARHASGSTMTRSLAREATIGGVRPGWCTTHRRAVAQEVAARTEELRGHVVALAQEDHQALRAELDRLHGTSRTG
jgi:hypothetical protein